MPDEDADGEIQFGPEIAPGVHSALRRGPDGEIRQVACGPAKDGTPLRPSSEIVHVSEASEEGWHKVTSLYKSGPAQVATPAYREGHDRIFGRKQKVWLA
jgi:hypothetical protein